MLKAMIMDFDGLIVDTEVVYYQIFSDWFRQKKQYALTMEDFLTCVGSHPEDLFQKLEAKYGFHVDRVAFQREIQERFLEESELLPVKDGVLEFIQAAKRAGLYLALATSAPLPKPLHHLKRLGLLEYFDLLVTADDVKRVKPFPDLFLKAVEKLGINKDEALIVEDSLNGLRSGLNAQMRVLVIPNDVTKHCTFKGYYRKADSLLHEKVSALIAEF